MKNKNIVRIALVTAFLLLIPLVAMQFSDEVHWRLFDFVAAGTLLFGSGLVYELIARKVGNTAYRAAVGIALAAVLILVWLSLGVGIIGRDGDPANRLYFGVLAVGGVGALIARFRPRGMAWTLLAMALAQMIVAAIALIAGLGRPWSGPLELLVLNAFFVVMFVVAALLFRHSAQDRPAGTQA